MIWRGLGWFCVLVIGLSACAQTPPPTTTIGDPQATVASSSSSAANTSPSADLSGIKTYLLDKTAELHSASTALQAASDRYYALAQQAQFDYATLWATQKDEVIAAINDGRNAWMQASPLYEQMEGIVAGTPALAEFDVNLDAGASAADGGDTVVTFDLNLPDGRVLSRPGNLFGVTESTLWVTFADYRVHDVAADFNGNGTIEFSEALPDAHVLKGGADMLVTMAADLQAAANAWQPTPSDAFTALVVMVPTMNEYFASWRDSRFVLGEQSQQRDFVAISRLNDIQDILAGLQVVHQGVSPLIQRVDPAQDTQIGQQLADLKAFVADVSNQEQSGKHFTPEQADILGTEAQDRATAITGQLTQVAAQLNIPLQQ